jgi:hypothetical protein
MRGFTKDDVEQHNDGGFVGPLYPSVNVKCYKFPDIDDVMERFGCSEKTAERALEYAFETHAEMFWETAKDDLTEHYFVGERLKLYSAGRSGGWLVVVGLPDIEDWDAIALSRWARFATGIRREVDWLGEKDNVLELIALNEWATDQASIEGMIAVALA